MSDLVKVRVVMLHLEGKALEWHHLFSQRRRGLPLLTWEIYAQGLVDRFGFESYLDPMEELVTHKQLGSIEQYYEVFVSLLNQLHLPESYALSIFVSNLKGEISQYLRLFKPQPLVVAYKLARKVEGIITDPYRKGLL